MPAENKIEQEPREEDAPISVPDSGDTGESGKLKMIVQLVKKCLGVKDIASMRLSLPASLLEPVPNLEFWHYLDRPDLFAAINDNEDAFERMLAVARFTFSKDIKFIKGKVCKPYNSVLGEHFRSHWDVVPVTYSADRSQPPIQHLYLSPAAAESVYPTPAGTPAATPGLNAPATLSVFGSPRLGAAEDASIKSGKSGKSAFSGFSKNGRTTPLSVSTAPTSPQQAVELNVEAQISSLSLNDNAASDEVLLEGGAPIGASLVRVGFITEQVSHHPPVSSYYATCPDRHIDMMGIDQISARVSGTSMRIAPGSFNKGIFLRLTGGPGEGEQYQITHPIASVNGLLRGSFYVTVGDSTIITCTGGAPGQKLRTILEYKEESWLGKAHYLLEGVIHTYTEGETEVEGWTKVKQVPKSRVLAYIDGSWKHLIRWRRASSDQWTPLLDLSTLHAVPKTVRPLEEQLPNESRKLWETVTTRLLNKEYSEATKYKQAIEQKQRDDATERKRTGVEFTPVYFERDIDSGIPVLTAEGRKALDVEMESGSFNEDDLKTPS